jgi:hypothetical protein
VQWRRLVRAAWEVRPELAIRFYERFQHPPVASEVTRLVRKFPGQACEVADALRFFLGEEVGGVVRPGLRVSFISVLVLFVSEKY